MKKSVRCLNLYQYVGFPTFLMFSSEAKSTLDLIFTKKPNRIDNVATGITLVDLRLGDDGLRIGK